ncbi:MAG: Zn-ribbon domain-containing OB-fold protein [Thermoprotei archaeon]|jgi:uncharacterized OB-fold protein
MSVPRYWAERITRYRMIGNKCKNCGIVYYPPKLSCSCGSDDMEPYQLPRKGILINYTWIYTAPYDHKKQEPYPIGLIQLVDGTKILAQLTDIEPEKLKEGIEVEAVFRKMSEDGDKGIIQYGIKFRPTLKSTNKH